MSSDPTPTFPLNARQLAKSLMPLTDTLEEFLLWPPDLFAFTSQVLSLTGAYHLVISPPRCEDLSDTMIWPPNDKWAEPSWDKYVRKVGLDWREKLRKAFTEKELLLCKKQSSRHQKRRTQALTGSLVNHQGSYKWQEGSWVPKEVGEHWKVVCRWMGSSKEGNLEDFLSMEGNVEGLLCNEEKQTPEDLQNNWEAFKALITLHAIADEACIGWGIRDLHLKRKKGGWEDPKEGGQYTESTPFAFAARCLINNGTLATINNQRCRVLPKRHTPKVGITLRSITSNLAFHRSSVDVKWKITEASNDLIDRMGSRDKTFSILLLPWPLEIRALDFMPAEQACKRLNLDRRKYGLFSYSPVDKWFNQRLLMDALDGALGETKAVDMVVLPECSLSKSEIDDFESVIGSAKYRVSSYVAGVRDNPDERGNRRFNDNMVYFKMGNIGQEKHAIVTYPPLESEHHADDIQFKHHRWKLERYQITNYSLGHVLSPDKEWWEAIKIRRRKVSFINIGRELTICPLICEDLARQDPIADLIRTVGPSLVITILMDGPQKKDRWSARYASVLSEDPGSAVITLTSLGMVERWRHPYHQHSRVVALWNDGKGLERELEEGAVGILLSLSVSGDKEPTADGRIENYATNTVTLGGIQQVRASRYKT
jgi:hypothetical protein